MKAIVADYIEKLMSQEFEISRMDDYSGRFMFGRTTVGIVTEQHPSNLLSKFSSRCMKDFRNTSGSVLKSIADKHDKSEEDTFDEITDSLEEEFSVDNMGLGWIIY